MNWVTISISNFLSFHGLLCLDKSKRSKNACFWITFVFINAYATHRICLWLFQTVKYGQPESTLYHVFTGVKIFHIAYWVNESLFNGKVVRRLYSFVFSNDQRLPFRSKETRLTLLNVYQVSILTLRVAGFVFQLVIPFTFEEKAIVHYQETFFYEIPFWNRHLTLFLILLNKFTLFYFSLIAVHFLQALLMYSIESLRFKVSELADHLTNSAGAVADIVDKHTKLFAEVREMDALLKWILFLWLIEWIGATYDLLMCFAIENSGIRKYRYSPQLYNFISVFSLFVLFFEISLLSDSTSLLFKAFHLRFKNRAKVLSSESPSYSRVFLQEKLRSAHLAFTVFETVVINQGAVRAILIGALSYGTYIFSVFSLKNSASSCRFCSHANYTLNHTDAR